jgi:hypothetical protein
MIITLFSQPLVQTDVAVVTHHLVSKYGFIKESFMAPYYAFKAALDSVDPVGYKLEVSPTFWEQALEIRLQPHIHYGNDVVIVDGQESPTFFQTTEFCESAINFDVEIRREINTRNFVVDYLLVNNGTLPDFLDKIDKMVVALAECAGTVSTKLRSGISS